MPQKALLGHEFLYNTFMFIQNLNGPWKFREFPQGEWLTGVVPGSVHEDLLRLERIPDPFFRDNEYSLKWISEKDWEYAREFELEEQLSQGDRIFLVCYGLDTLAEVDINNQEVGRTANMFRRYRWDITKLLQQNQNHISIRFHSPVKYVAQKQKEFPLISPLQSIAGGPYLRKAAYQFGWDWAPTLPTSGIWKDIRLEAFQHARLVNVHFRQAHSPQAARILADVTVERWDTQELQLRMTVTSPSGETTQTTRRIADTQASLSIEIPHPELWWPNGLGEQPLYQVNLNLEGEGEVLDKRDVDIGLRTLQLITEPDEWGHSFTFQVNGVPIFSKGSNWIPADIFPARISSERLEQLIRSAAATHQNMLRVWGGGYYESDTFYQLCDRYGILIWQDFMFSCADYPFGDPAFLENIQVEIVQNVRRLRHHACLGLWCGNNEMEWGWVEWGWDKPGFERYKAAYEQFFYQTLPAILSEEDPDHHYWPSSPSSGIAFQSPNSSMVGDSHYWDVWHGRKPFSAYEEQFPRFMSEFGFQALPPQKTVDSYTIPEDRNLTSYVMEQHQKSPVGNDLIISQMAAHFRLPKDFDSLVYLSMILQAEGIRHGVEHWRRNRSRVSGTLYWQLDDCWPVVSWSSIDYYGRWKALHYFAQDFYAPLLLSAIPAGPSIDLIAVNDYPAPQLIKYDWSLQALDGQILMSGHASGEIPGLEAYLVESLDLANFLNPENIREVVFAFHLHGVPSWKIVPFTPDKYLDLPDPKLEFTTIVKDGVLSIHIISHALARYVAVELMEIDTIFNMNYFDLPAGETIEVFAQVPKNINEEYIREKLRIRSLYDSYTHAA